MVSSKYLITFSCSYGIYAEDKGNSIYSCWETDMRNTNWNNMFRVAGRFSAVSPLTNPTRNDWETATGSWPKCLLWIPLLHPRINNFNDIVIFLMECNMDIKYIGSGEAAKALVFYITDYITKASLATHVQQTASNLHLSQTHFKSYCNVIVFGWICHFLK